MGGAMVSSLIDQNPQPKKMKKKKKEPGPAQNLAK